MTLSKELEAAREFFWHPLDNLNTEEEVKQRRDLLGPYVRGFKSGMESHTLFGTDIINWVHKDGNDNFLDLKFHDIPNTVRGAVRAAAKHGIYMCNVHIIGGGPMLEAAMEGAEEGAEIYGNKKPLVAGVTVLTSLDLMNYLAIHTPHNSLFKSAISDGITYMKKGANDDEVNAFIRGRLGKDYENVMQDAVNHLAFIGVSSGLDAIICSAADLPYLERGVLPSGIKLVTPGVKGPDGSVGADQARTTTPGLAVKHGATDLVVGRALLGKTPEETEEKAVACLQDVARYL